MITKSRPKMYVPSSFIVEDVKRLEFSDCKTFELKQANERSYNLLKSSFKGNETIVGWDIYLEDTRAVFLDKLNSAINNEERILL